MFIICNRTCLGFKVTLFLNVFLEGGGQRAWAKLWFRSDSPFSHKTNYELNWPSASHYKQKTTLGPKQVTRQEFPSHSIGKRKSSTSLFVGLDGFLCIEKFPF